MAGIPKDLAAKARLKLSDGTEILHRSQKKLEVQQLLHHIYGTGARSEASHHTGYTQAQRVCRWHRRCGQEDHRSDEGKREAITQSTSPGEHKDMDPPQAPVSQIDQYAPG